MTTAEPGNTTDTVGHRAAFTEHRCARRHRAHQTLAECRWPEAAWVVGDGPFALLAHCDMLSISLHDTRAAAEAALARLDELRCCRACDGRHEIVVLFLR